MSSSTSDSDAGLSTAWGRCIAVFLGALGAGALLVLALMILVDPYDSGRFGLLGIVGTDDTIVAMAQAGRARDPQFDSAVIGNSTAQLIRPDQLSAATGKRFVQLFVPGSLPSQQMAVLDFFLRHHARAGALVMVIDDPWCAHSAVRAPDDIFPYWLYGASTLRYTAHLFTWRAFDLAFRRIGIGLGKRKREREDGFSDYEKIYPPGTQQPADTLLPQSLQDDGAVSDVFPFRDMLGQVIRRLPSDAGIVLVVPPIFYRALPQPGTLAARERKACNASFRSVIAGRPHGNFIDYRIDNALTRNPANFLDLIHYRAVIGQRVTAGIIASLRDGAAARIDF